MFNDEGLLGAATPLAYAEKQAIDALARSEEAKTAIIGLSQRVGVLESALNRLNARLMVLESEKK